MTPSNRRPSMGKAVGRTANDSCPPHRIPQVDEAIALKAMFLLRLY